ncbi:MAG: hypothetical protein GYA69_00845 [Candidatus Moranbacteria bacterium]|nr:hypothetical protein [Candidatus Moranbacteria bacterium]
MFNINLRGTDYRIVFEHNRRGDNYTTCWLIHQESKTRVDAARSFCSKKDHFNKNEGRKLALTRLVNNPNWNFTREERKAIWEAYSTVRHGKVD